MCWSWTTFATWRRRALAERYIAGVLKSVGGSKTKAAEILGVDASTLYRREKRSS